MTIKTFIEKAIEGGYRWKDRVRDYPYEMAIDTFREEWSGIDADKGVMAALAILDPLAWQAVGKVEGWNNSEYICTFGSQHPSLASQFRGTAYAVGSWRDNMHRMIDTLAVGDTIEQYLETL